MINACVMPQVGTINTHFSQVRSVLLVPTHMGIKSTMTNSTEQREKERRAERLVQARTKANVGGAKAVSDKFGWNVNKYKAHESGRNGFGIADAKRYAKAYNVSVAWLNFGVGSPEESYTDDEELKAEAISLFDNMPPALQEAVVQHMRTLASLSQSQAVPTKPAKADQEAE